MYFTYPACEFRPGFFMNPFSNLSIHISERYNFYKVQLQDNIIIRATLFISFYFCARKLCGIKYQFTLPCLSF